MSDKLNPDKALIFRIVHRDNVPWILENGMHCRNSTVQDPRYRTIGNPDLIDKRQHRLVPIAPGGTLSDYVPFYFTPYTPMMLNIKIGYGGVTKLPNEEIVILVSSLRNMAELGQTFVFSDRHAYLLSANFYSDLADLGNIDWAILQQRDFKRNPDDPEKVERYQAEALIHQAVPTEALLGVVCYTDDVKSTLDQIATERGLKLQIAKRTGWYF
ncbi:MAG: hypothetical protein A2V90_07010 [Gammaproteobacteria bacterium RBG_16_57_12]|nr:MAG: hypothetical protein A2V90_07010 [Gammaproteobacteria bacterium RBG_16_57_12]